MSLAEEIRKLNQALQERGSGPKVTRISIPGIGGALRMEIGKSTYDLPTNMNQAVHTSTGQFI